MKKYEFSIKDFVKKFDYKETDSEFNSINLLEEWKNHINSLDKSVFNEILISPEIVELALPECIIRSYLKLLIEYDISNKWLLINDNLREIYDCVASKSTFSENIGYFKASYSVYSDNLKHNFRSGESFSNFERRFYDFLTEYSFIHLHDKSGRLIYAVPEHLALIFICIISAWRFSTVAEPCNSRNRSVSFSDFRKKALDTLDGYSFLDNSYKLSADYLLHYFFNDECSDFNKIHYFKRNSRTEFLLRNEHKNYSDILLDVKNFVPFLFLKMAYIDGADIILKNNVTFIENPVTEYKEIPEISSELTEFFKSLKELTGRIRKIESEIIDKKILKYKYTMDQIIYYMKPESVQEYISELKEYNYLYAEKLRLLCLLLRCKISECEKSLEINSFSSNIGRFDSAISDFLSGVYKHLDAAISRHEKLLADGYKAKKKYEEFISKSSKRKVKIQKSLFVTDYLYKQVFEVIFKDIRTLKDNLGRIPPLQLRVIKGESVSYAVLSNSIKSSVKFYENLFLSFYDKIRMKENNKEKLLNILRSYINNNAGYIRAELIPESDFELKQNPK